MNKTKQRLMDLTAIIYDLNELTPHDWFFNLSSHVGAVDVYYYEYGYAGQKKQKYITTGTYYSDGPEPIERLIDELRGYLP